jgi:hypothetical protein
MNKKAIKSLIEIAKQHRHRLLYVISHLTELFPLTAEKVANLTDKEFIYVDLLVSRFCRLQDFMGAKFINLILDELDEFSDSMTIIDKLNKLEKFRLIKDARLWREIRNLRNHLIHEYPNHPERLALYLNEAYKLSFELLEVLDNLLTKLESIPSDTES